MQLRLRSAELQHDFADPFELYADQQNCGGVYTSMNGCHGWANTDLEQCKQYCMNNEWPSNCDPIPGTICNYVSWNANQDWLPGWCHLGETCDLYEMKRDFKVEVWKKKTNRSHASSNTGSNASTSSRFSDW